MAVDPSARSWKAGLPWSTADSFAGRLSKLGGTLVMTDTEVVFKPPWHLGRTSGSTDTSARDDAVRAIAAST